LRPAPPSPFRKHLHCIKDPRHHNTRHLPHDILMIAPGAIISGADSWTQVAEYGRSKLDWFQDFLELPNGILAHDTFGRLFARIDPQEFHDFFSRRVREPATSLQGKTVAIDGKTLCGSHDRATGRPALHLVSAWVSELRLVLGHLKTDDKSNEITAIPELIKTLDLRGAVVTLDAMGCQKKIAQAIREHWGIENGLHWCLDIAFREDHCRVRKDHGPEKLAILRHLATNMLKRENSLKGGIQTERLKAAWGQGYLLKVLTT
jgi:predicted transposase YbfD/YdcC